MNDVLTRPLAYGYLRVIGPADKAMLVQLHQQMRGYAHRRQFTLGHVFVEIPTSPVYSFEHLVAKLKQGDATELIVPTLDHFTRFTSLQVGVVSQLEALGVTVWVVAN